MISTLKRRTSEHLNIRCRLTVDGRAVLGGARTGAFMLLVLLLAGCGPARQLPVIPTIPTEAFEPLVRNEIANALATVQRRPRNARVNGRLAMALHAYRIFAHAEIAYRRARLLDPDAFRWAYYHADVLLALGWQDDAARVFREAIALDPDYHPARARLASLLIREGDLEGSAALLDAVLASDPEHGEALYEYGRIHLRRDNFQQAIAAFERSIAAAGPDAAAYFGIAQAYRNLGDSDRAERFQALHARFVRQPPRKKDPRLAEIAALNHSSTALLDRARAHYEGGDKDRAIEVIGRVLNDNADNIAAHTALVGIYARMRQFDLADRHYGVAAGLSPVPAVLHLNLAVARVAEGRWVEAASLVEDALAIAPGHAAALTQLGNIRSTQGRVDDAIENYRLALTNDPGLLMARERLAKNLVAAARYREAVEVLARIPPLDDATTVRMLLILATAHENLDEYGEAVAALTQAQAATAADIPQRLRSDIRRRLDRLATNHN